MNTVYCSLGLGLERALRRESLQIRWKTNRMSVSSWAFRVRKPLTLLTTSWQFSLFGGRKNADGDSGKVSNKGADVSVKLLSTTGPPTIQKERKFFTGGNFKMNGSKKDIEDLINALKSANLDPNVDVVISPPTIYLQHTKSLLPNNIELAAQNTWKKEKGAFTGETSPSMVKDIGGNWVILGHSERRQIFGETNELIGEKICRAIYDGLKVIACVGETLEERNSGKTEAVVLEQVQHIAAHVKDWNALVIAYEPVWAIGTSQVATPAQAQEMHCTIRKWLNENISECAADVVRIIYGGSVNADNCQELAKQDDIDGFLVGGASLKPEFVDIVNVIQNSGTETKPEADPPK